MGRTSLLNNGLVITNQTSTNNYAIILKGDADITLYNALGVIVKKSTLNEGENIINADDLKAGVYIWKTPTSITALITATSTWDVLSSTT